METETWYYYGEVFFFTTLYGSQLVKLEIFLASGRATSVRWRFAPCARSAPQGQSSLQLLRPNRIWPTQISINSNRRLEGLFQIASNHNFVSNCAAAILIIICATGKWGAHTLSAAPPLTDFFNQNQLFC